VARKAAPDGQVGLPDADDNGFAYGEPQLRLIQRYRIKCHHAELGQIDTREKHLQIPPQVLGES